MSRSVKNHNLFMFCLPPKPRCFLAVVAVAAALSCVAAGIQLWVYASAVMS